MTAPLLKPEDFDVTAPPFWHEHKAGLQKALDHAGNTHSLEHVRAAIETQDAQWFATQDCAFVTEIISYPLKTVGRIWLATGNLKALKAMQPYMVQWFKQHGCEAILCLGREGWGRAIPGAKRHSIMFVLEI